MYAKLTIGFFVVLAVATILARAQVDNPVPKKGVTLLGTLAEWQYPNSEFGGASMSDGVNRALQSVNCQAILTTTDSVEKVAKFYTEKFVSGPADANATIRSSVAQSVSEQDDSKGRPLQLRTIVVNRAATSTTLVISRADDEKRTHIAWSHYMRFEREP